MPKLNVMGPSKKGISAAANNQESLNCYVIPSVGGRNEMSMTSCMGSKLHSDTVGEPRGIYTKNKKTYAVIGTTLFEIFSNGSFTNRGIIPGVGPVSISDDGDTIIIVNGTTTGYYYDIDSDSLRQVNLPYLANSVTYLDTYMIFTSNDRLFFISNVGVSDAFNALDFARVSQSTGELISVVADHGELVFFTSTDIEIWYNSGDVNFAFAKNTSAVIERGAISAPSVAREDNSITFLGDDLIVYRLEGYQPVRISNVDVELILSNLKKEFTTDLENARAFFFTEHGHKFYQLTIPNQTTIVYDIATQEWHTRKHYDYKTHHGVFYTFAFGRHLILNLVGQVFEMSKSIYDDAGRPLIRLRRTACYSIDDKIMSWKLLKFIFDFGNTKITSGQGSDPQLMIKWSYDYGATWRGEKWRSLGVSGDRKAKANLRGLGSSRHRLLEFSCSDPVPFELIDCYIEYS